MAVLITGSTEGLGYAFARLYAAKGETVLIHGKDPAKLAHAAASLRREYPFADIQPLQQDLAEKDGGAKLADVSGNWDIEVLINNAGIGYTGEAVEIDPKKEADMAQVNIVSMLQLTRILLPKMHAGGIVLNIASTGAFQPGPLIAEYYASKTFVVSYTRALAREWQGRGVIIACLCPGPLRTAFYDKSGLAVPHMAMDPEEAASYALSHLKNGAVIIPDALSKVLRYVPSRIKEAYVYRAKKKVLRGKKY